VRVTDIIANTYYARVHVARAGGEGEVDVDARPSDAINLAVRFGAPVYIAKKIAGARLVFLWCWFGEQTPTGWPHMTQAN
jgi:bifunctional DNase/RNase